MARPALLGLLLVASSCGRPPASGRAPSMAESARTRTHAPEPQPSTATRTEAEPAHLSGLVASHNRVRAEVRVAPLLWSSEVAAAAQRWADRLAASGCRLQHNPRTPHGENLFWTSVPVDTSRVVAAWAAEKKNYRYATNTCPGGVCGHYTQVVWARSTKLGCGVATCGSAQVWVCNYDPPGNVIGQKPY
jgi:pathogenesis-related protein 1